MKDIFILILALFGIASFIAIVGSVPYKQPPLSAYWTWEQDHFASKVTHENQWECLYGMEPVGYIDGAPAVLMVCRKDQRIVAGFGVDGSRLP